MPEPAYIQAFQVFYGIFIKIGAWLILAGLAAAAIYVFGWGSGYATRAKEEIERENQSKREEAICQKF